MKWNDAKEVVPNDERMVLCRGERGACYMAKYKDGYYWNRSMIRGGDCDPIEWMDVPKESIKTKEIKYFDEDEKVWKIGKVIIEGGNQ